MLFRSCRWRQIIRFWISTIGYGANNIDTTAGQLFGPVLQRRNRYGDRDTSRLIIGTSTQPEAQQKQQNRGKDFSGRPIQKKHRGHDKIQTTHTYPARHRKRLYAADPAHDRKNRRKHHSPSVQEGHKTSDATPTVAPRRNKGAECNEA